MIIGTNLTASMKFGPRRAAQKWSRTTSSMGALSRTSQYSSLYEANPKQLSKHVPL